LDLLVEERRVVNDHAFKEAVELLVIDSMGSFDLPVKAIVDANQDQVVSLHSHDASSGFVAFRDRTPCRRF
jgi:hypothetical protein